MSLKEVSLHLILGSMTFHLDQMTFLNFFHPFSMLSFFNAGLKSEVIATNVFGPLVEEEFAHS
jgi:hypothetical protein